MHSLFFRIFISFWVAMALIVGGSMAFTAAIASRENDPIASERRPALALEAAQVLSRGGVAQLRAWLRQNKQAIPERDFFIIDTRGHDLLNRKLSEPVAHRVELWLHGLDPLPGMEPGAPPSAIASRAPPEIAPRAPPQFTSRPPEISLSPPPREMGSLQTPPRGAVTWRPFVWPQIRAPDGEIYTLVFSPRRPMLFGALSLPGIPLAVLGISLSISAMASLWLARHFSAPIRRIQAGARALASDDMSVRVSDGLAGRRDELAVLARDFDAMADQLRAARTARTDLLRDISHELRSPLARMRVALGIARQPGADPARQLDRLDVEIERLDALISQILKLSRLQGSGASLERERLELDDLLEEVAADARFEAAAKECTVGLIGASGLFITGHRELLRSAVENVLRNAVRYAPPGSRVELERRGGAAVEVYVRDRGEGVPDAHLMRIFEPFYRVAAARDRGSGGEGIGLAITAHVMRAHGGTATAVNRPGGGLEVALRLPAA